MFLLYSDIIILLYYYPVVYTPPPCQQLFDYLKLVVPFWLPGIPVLTPGRCILTSRGVILVSWGTILLIRRPPRTPNRTPWGPDLDVSRFLMDFGSMLVTFSSFGPPNGSTDSIVVFLLIWEQTWHQNATPGCL